MRDPLPLWELFLICAYLVLVLAGSIRGRGKW